ncbi:DUF4369 domain-containing protein [Cesiribacter andamanensis]|uniref:DUF4369 domain-containing protein n=1 Tax=Cesiribacter andamanensis AMV16 TaxID=1279009 RepID=M7NHV1_9BACT|nr:DUF4369 domain-containing protein [Cesiribacter andamanensis]EMR01385.1 hypothetical protein ADICEAN_03473 [Cesiribacter andamanensis AMV16]
MIVVQKISLLLLLAAVGSCSNNKGNGNSTADANTDPNAVVLSGTIANAPAQGLVILEEIRQSQAVPVDTLAVTNNSFSQQVAISEPGFFRLNLYNQQYVTLVLGSEDVQITADMAAAPGNARVQGSTDTRYLDEINQLVQQSQQQVAALEQQFLQARQEGNSVRMKELEQQYLQGENSCANGSKPNCAAWKALLQPCMP